MGLDLFSEETLSGSIPVSDHLPWATTKVFAFWVVAYITGGLTVCPIDNYSRTPVTRTLKGNEKHFELMGNTSYRGKF